jgi:hypothetical protein
MIIIIVILAIASLIVSILSITKKESFQQTNDDLVIFITRYVNSEKTNQYWQKSLKAVRSIYPTNKVFIIDDNSPYEPSPITEVNVQLIQSEFPKRAEILPYHYFLKLKPSKKAIIIHDSVFLNQRLPDVETYRFLWEFPHNWDNDSATLDIIQHLDGNLEKTYNDKSKWNGCFGAMSIISWNFLNKINKKLNLIPTALKIIQSRDQRMCFERIFACACVNLDKYRSPIFGEIHDWVKAITKGKKDYGLTYEEYLNADKFPIFKVWSGR